MKLGRDPPSQLVLTTLERSVLAALAARLGADGAIVEEQVRRARVSLRSHSGVGFVTRLDVPADTASLSEQAALRLPTIHASHPGLREPAEFLVQLKSGRLASIEAFCHEGTWPADEGRFAVGSGR
jgi:hypothetical protein